MTKVDKIFHIADIHIRNLKRHKEYRKVFSNLYKEIKNRKTNNSLIVVAGDIAHSKTDMSPELVDMTKDFFTNLTKLCPTIIITGNHDCNLNNTYRLDVLSPIVDSLNNKKLHYLKDSGIYNFGDVDFVVWSIYDEEESYIRAKDVKTDNKKIGLYHGPVNSARTDAGFSIYNNKVTVDMMEGYDMFLLGDIHSFQYLNDEETIAYPASLVQQNHGENLNGHGMLVWDVDTKQSEFVEIENEYGYYTLDVVDGKVPVVSDMPKKPRLRVKITNTDSADLKNALKEIRKKYKVDEFTIIRTDTLSQQKTGDRENSIHYENIQNPEHQNGLIKDYVERNYPHLDEEIIGQIQDINRELNTKIPEEEVVRNIRWTPIKFEFDNMFSYGEDNVIDFTNMNGVLGLFAPNTSGKSSVFDALSYCIFDKCSRAFKADHIVNNRKNDFYSKFHFRIDNVDYFIEKSGRRQKRGNIKVDIEFWKEEGGVKTSLNGEQRRDTSSIIRQYLGSYEDFIFTCLSLQGNNSVFIDKSQSERKDLLAQLMGLNIFDKLYQVGNDEIRETNALLRKFKRDDFTEELANLEITKSELEQVVKESEEKEVSLKQELDELDDFLEEEYEKLHSVDETLNIDEINDEIKKSEDEKVQIQIDKRSHDEKLKDYKKQLVTLNTKIVRYKNIEKEYDEWISRKHKRDDIVDEIDKHKIQVEQTLKRLESVKNNLTFEVNDQCQSCINNVKKFNEEYDTILQELNQQKLYADKLVGNKNQYNDVLEREYLQQRFDEYTILTENSSSIDLQKERLENIIHKCDTDIERLEKQLELYHQQVDEYYSNENKIKENLSTRKVIDQLKDTKKKTKSQYDTSQNEIKKLYNEIGSIDNKTKELQGKIDEAKELEEKLEAYQYYLDSVKRDGVPYELIAKTIPMIQDEVNNILQQIVDFNMNIQVDGKNINARLVYEDREWPLEMGSGMERFISGVAIRVALMNISNLPRPNFIALDEGFGVLDSDNFNSLFMLFQYLKTQFDFIIVISHLDSMRDVVNDFIEIEKRDGFSKITHH